MPPALACLLLAKSMQWGLNSLAQAQRVLTEVGVVRVSPISKFTKKLRISMFAEPMRAVLSSTKKSFAWSMPGV